MPGRHAPPEERFWRFVEKTDGCWLWVGGKSPMGYGRIKLAEGVRLAHRLSYEMHVGKLPVGAVIDHLCRTPACVNPGHLEAVAPIENWRRGLSAAGKGRCRRGHDASNFVRHRSGRTAYCRICRNDKRRERYRVDPEWRQALLAGQRAAHHRKGVPASGN